MSGLHIGKLIKAKVEASGMSKSEFARRIKTTPQNAFGIFKRKSIDTDMLQRISTALNYNFFDHYQLGGTLSRDLQEPGKDYKKTSSACEERLEQSLKEIEYLKKINELLEKNRN